MHPIRGFKNRRKVLDEALAEMQPQDISYRNFAMNQVVRDYAIKKLKNPIPADAAERFYALLEQYVHDAEQLPPFEE